MTASSSIGNIFLALLAIGLPPASGAIAKPSAPAEQWIKLRSDGDGTPQAMQTAVASYAGERSGRPVRVDLVGAVHVGDKSYYAALNRLFRGYDIVLYELVAPEGTRVGRGAKASSRNPLGAMQNGMSTTLELVHQLEHVDYTRPNFVHADMSPDQLFDSMTDRGESMVMMYFKFVGQSIAEQSRMAAKGESAEIDLFKAMFAPDRTRQLKIAMAKQMVQLQGLIDGFGGETGSALIHERNRIALDKLSEQLESGVTNVAVFYGAGHLADMDRRLREDFGMRQTKKTWVDAWDLTAR